GSERRGAGPPGPRLDPADPAVLRGPRARRRRHRRRVARRGVGPAGVGELSVRAGGGLRRDRGGGVPERTLLGPRSAEAPTAGRPVRSPAAQPDALRRRQGGRWVTWSDGGGAARPTTQIPPAPPDSPTARGAPMTEQPADAA